jgi:hypothetical protein
MDEYFKLLIENAKAQMKASQKLLEATQAMFEANKALFGIQQQRMGALKKRNLSKPAKVKRAKDKLIKGKRRK